VAHRGGTNLTHFMDGTMEDADAAYFAVVGELG
jgi:hypothetical protein